MQERDCWQESSIGTATSFKLADFHFRSSSSQSAASSHSSLTPSGREFDLSANSSQSSLEPATPSTSGLASGVLTADFFPYKGMNTSPTTPPSANGQRWRMENLAGSLVLSISKSQTRMTSYKTVTPARSKRITQLIGNMVAVDLQPFSMVEDKGFRELLELLAPGYKVPCRGTIKSRVDLLMPEMC